MTNEMQATYQVEPGFTDADRRLIARAMAVLQREMRQRPALNAPQDVGRYLAMRFAGAEVERFVGVMLDSQHRLIEAVELARGTIDGATVYPREVVKAALAHNAAAVIFAHNHPSGVPEPSTADRLLTERLKEALSTVDVRTLDHFVVGGAKWVSLAERGWI